METLFQLNWFHSKGLTVDIGHSCPWKGEGVLSSVAAPTICQNKTKQNKTKQQQLHLVVCKSSWFSFLGVPAQRFSCGHPIRNIRGHATQPYGTQGVIRGQDPQKDNLQRSTGCWSRYRFRFLKSSGGSLGHSLLSSLERLNALSQPSDSVVMMCLCNNNNNNNNNKSNQIFYNISRGDSYATFCNPARAGLHYIYAI